MTDTGSFQHCFLRGLSGFSALATLFVNSAVLAQTVPQPNIARPPTREELQPVPPSPDQPTARLEVTDETERSACPLADPQYADITADISQVEFGNLKGATVAELNAVVAPFLGNNQPIGIVCEIRDAAATYLRAKGYLAAAEVPTQRIENGLVRIELLYARVTAIRARGQTQGAETMIARYLEKLTEDEIFDRNRAERYLLLARDLPGYNVQLTLRPADGAPGELIGEVSVLRQPYVVDFTLQNLAGRDTGRWGGQLRAQFFGLTGLGDATTIALYSTADFREQQIFQAGHEFRLGSEGLKLAGNFTYAWTEPNIGPLASGAELQARTLIASISAEYPLLRSQRSNLNVSGGFDYIDQRVRFIAPLSRDRLRVLWARLAGDAIDPVSGRPPQWRVGGAIELRQGLDVLNAGPNCRGVCAAGVIPPSRIDGDPTGTLLRGSAEIELSLGTNFSFVVRPTAQYGFNALYSYEEFSGGNFTAGRGYDPAVIIGDSGVGVQYELRSKPITPVSGSDVALSPYVFTDLSYVWNKNVPAPADPQRLVSIGAGVRATFADRARLDVTLAIPTEAAGLQTQRGDVRLLIQLTTRLLPWGIR